MCCIIDNKRRHILKNEGRRTILQRQQILLRIISYMRYSSHAFHLIIYIDNIYEQPNIGSVFSEKKFTDLQQYIPDCLHKSTTAEIYHRQHLRGFRRENRKK